MPPHCPMPVHADVTRQSSTTISFVIIRRGVHGVSLFVDLHTTTRVSGEHANAPFVVRIHKMGLLPRRLHPNTGLKVPLPVSTFVPQDTSRARFSPSTVCTRELLGTIDIGPAVFFEFFIFQCMTDTLCSQ